MVKPKTKSRRFADKTLLCLTWLFAAVTISVLLFIVGFILANGIPHLRLSLFEAHFTSQNQSMLPSIISTFALVILTLLIAVPIGISTSIYLVEYTKKGNRLVNIIRSATEILAGIPSIVYGLFGMLFFVSTLGFGFSMIAGSLTLTIMILPLVIRTTEEALKSVPDGYREGAFALGSGKLRALLRVVLPSSIPGILAGVILATGRIVGETAALIFTAGAVAQMPSGLDSSIRTLAVHLWTLSSEGIFMDEAFATAVVLLLIVLIINTASAFIAKRFTKG